LGQISYEELHAAYAEQMRALVEAGVDALIIETCQDLLQVKIALVTCFEVLEECGRNMPVLVSVTVETTGTLLAGSDIAAVAATVEPFPVFSLGLNCATGPAEMESYIRYLGRNWPRRISCIPNAGLPEVVEGRTVYPLGPAEYAERMKAFVEREGVSVVGGCCGTTPEHIAHLVSALNGVTPAVRDAHAPPSAASLYQAVELA
jgi:5-methyltetrahydrofolate--homocysteine methyltransferase